MQRYILLENDDVWEGSDRCEDVSAVSPELMRHSASPLKATPVCSRFCTLLYCESRMPTETLEWDILYGTMASLFSEVMIFLHVFTGVLSVLDGSVSRQ